MVQIEAPVDGPPASAVISAAAAERIAVPRPPATPPPDFASPPAAERPPAEVPAMEFVEAPPPPAAAAVKTSPIIWWASGGAALVFLGVVAVVMWSGGDGQASSPPPAASSPETMAAVEPPVVPEPSVPQSTDERGGEVSPPTTAEAVPDTAAVEPAESPGDSALPKLPADESMAVGDPAAPQTAPALPPMAGEGKSDRETSNPDSNEPRAGTAPVLTFDPLDFDPARLSLGTVPRSNSPSSAASIANAAESQSAAADEHESQPSDGEPEGGLLSDPARDETLSVRRGPMPGNAPHGADGPERLAMDVDTLELNDVPLAEFVDVLSRLTGVAITLDAEALQLAGISPRETVSIRASGTTVQDILRDVLDERRLELAERGGALRIVLRNAEKRRTIAYKVSDLCPDGDADRFAALVERFVAPASWQSAGGRGSIAVDGTTLRIEQAQAVHHEILVFCERLRLARGLAPRSRYPAELLSIEPPHDVLAPLLRRPTTFTFLPWTPLSDVLRHWQEASGVTILVDWAALADVELFPRSPVACSAIDRTWEDVLDEILETLELAWWPMDSGTLEITTPDAAAETRRIEFYEIPTAFGRQFAGYDQMIDSLRTGLSTADGGERHGPIATQLEFDEASGRLLVVASPVVHRQLSRQFATQPSTAAAADQISK